MSTSYVFRVDGSIDSIENTLENWQEAVGGHVERIQAIRGHSMLVNEDGRLRNLPLNIIMSLYGEKIGVGPIVGDVIYPNAIPARGGC